MNYEMLKTAAANIRMPEERKYRVIQNCKKEIINNKENFHIKKNTVTSHIRKPAALLAAIVICLSLSVTAFATTGQLQGFFRDITNFRGAVVGTSYEQATNEIDMSATASENTLIVLATFADPQMMPYSEAEKLGIAAYKIVNANGKVVMEGTAESTKIVNGRAAITIPLDGVDSGSYKLVITAFVMEKKADQPLNLNGTWECAFEK